MKKPRKKYKPRDVKPLAALVTLRRAAAAQSTAPLGSEQKRSLALGYSGALQAMVSGTATDDDYGTLACAANIGLVLCEYGLGDIATAHAAQDACMTIAQRAQRLGRYALAGAELRALQDFVVLHDAQLASPDCTEAVMVAVLREVRKRAEAGHVLELAA